MHYLQWYKANVVDEHKSLMNDESIELHHVKTGLKMGFAAKSDEICIPFAQGYPNFCKMVRIVSNGHPCQSFWNFQTPVQWAHQTNRKGHLKISVVVIPKENLQPSLRLVWYRNGYRIGLCYLHRFYCPCHTTRHGWAGASQTFFWYDSDKDLKACFCMIRPNRLGTSD